MAEPTISLAELGEHVGELRRLHREAMTSDDETPELSFADVRARCDAILGMLDRAEGRTSDADIDDLNETDRSIHPVDGGPRRGNDNPPRTGGTPPAPTGSTASDRMPLGEAFTGETRAQGRRAVAEVFGERDPAEVVDRLVRNTHIATPELGALKGKR